MDKRILVLGAGLAGLSAARHLGGLCDVFEKAPYVGGHCHTRELRGFSFDEGAHVFFGKDECSQEFVLKPLEAELIHHTAEIWNNYGGRLYGRYPVQTNLHALPPEVAARCVRDFIEASEKPERHVRTYEEWCHAAFGTTLAEEFLLRYARKVWTVEPAELTTEWLGSGIGNRISRPPAEDVIRGATDPTPQTMNYLTSFSYPARGGFGRVVQPLASQASGVRVGCGVTRVETAGHRITFADGTVRQYDAAISTIPLPELVRLTVDASGEVQEAARQLMWTSVRCVNLGVARPGVGPGHWVYFYDHAIPFFRLSFPGKLAPVNVLPGHSSISCEIAYSRRKPLDGDRLVERVVDALRQTGVLQESDRIVLQDQVDIPYAYVVYDFDRAQCLRTIHSWMESVGLYPCGRFGEWGYHWSFEAIESGRRVATQVAERLGVSVTV